MVVSCSCLVLLTPLVVVVLSVVVVVVVVVALASGNPIANQVPLGQHQLSAQVVVVVVVVELEAVDSACFAVAVVLSVVQVPSQTMMMKRS